MTFSMLSVAYAMAPGGGEGSPGSQLTSFIPLILMFVIFYFLLIRPQQTKAKKHQEILNTLKRDDMVITTGGMYGKITGVTDTVITLEIAPNVRIKVSKSSIAGKSDADVKQADEKTK
ncbi:MAG: preprotein translocase subunit YajC [Pseudomonadota bacterium]